MTIDTRDFGNLDVSEEGILHFQAPILGFEGSCEYVVLYDDELGEMFSWMQAVDDKDLCFITVDPRLVDESYSPSLPGAVRRKLDLKKGEEPVFHVLISIPNSFKDATANLKSPVIINPKNNKAMQFVLDEDYPVQALLLKEEG
ncbi:MAG: flagellar assembly protein FliW [Oscillospiraceae bacterium]